VNETATPSKRTGREGGLRIALALVFFGQLCTVAGCFQAPETEPRAGVSADGPAQRGESATGAIATPAQSSTVAPAPDAVDSGLERVADPATSGDTPSLEALSEAAVKHPDPAVRQEAVAGLAEQGDGGIPALTQALRDADSSVRIEAVESLSDIGGESAKAALAIALQDPDVTVRGAAEDAFADLEQREVYGH
jgi:hypothetical protein